MFEAPAGSEAPAGARQQRLFFALWPPEPLRNQLERATCSLARDSGGRVVPARNFHVTVVFLGEVPQPRVQAVIAAAAATSAPAFTLTLDRIDAWPESNVLVLTCADAPAELVTLAEGLRFNLLRNQIKLKREIFRPHTPHTTPHVTLARNLSQLRPAEKIEALQWPVQEFVLIDSTITHSGSEYQVLARWPLA